MNARFLHLADCHLGYKQYNSITRYNDFARAFLHIIDVAVRERVDFVILAGDLFQKRAVDALTLYQAISGLERLKAANIPCIAVEGNHEKPYYNDEIGWMTFLSQRELLVLLHPIAFEEGVPVLTAHKRGRGGAFVDPVPGLRVYGLQHTGAGTAKAVEGYAEAIKREVEQAEASGTGDVTYRIFVAHAGVANVIPGHSGGLSEREWGLLRPPIDYLALGHVHKPFLIEEWIHNPGSPETCSTMEAQWSDRGYFLVDVDMSANVDTSAGAEASARQSAVLHTNPRRPFQRLSIKVDVHTSPDALYDHCRELFTRKARDAGTRGTLDDKRRPVVDVLLTGTLAFDRSALDFDVLRDAAHDAFQAMHVQVRNTTSAMAFDIAPEEHVSRSQLERQVLAELIERDARYRSASAAWADAALALKSIALRGAAPDTILSELRAQLSGLKTTALESVALESAAPESKEQDAPVAQ